MALSPRTLDDRLSVHPQITEADIAEAAKLGFKTIINNRPDGEEPGQLASARAADVARANGLDYVYLPFTSATLTPDVVSAFGRALQEKAGPILAHCRSGTRCSQVWALSEAARGEIQTDEILSRAAEAGYDLEPMRMLLDNLAPREPTE